MEGMWTVVPAAGKVEGVHKTLAEIVPETEGGAHLSPHVVPPAG